MAFKTNLSSLSICAIVNEECDKVNFGKWLQLDLLNSNLVFNAANSTQTETEEFISFIPQNVLDEIGEAVIEDEISKNLTQLSSSKAKSSNYVVGDFFCIKNKSICLCRDSNN